MEPQDMKLNLGLVLRGSLYRLEEVKRDIVEKDDVNIVYQVLSGYRLKVIEK